MYGEKRDLMHELELALTGEFSKERCPLLFTQVEEVETDDTTGLYKVVLTFIDGHKLQLVIEDYD